MRLALFEPDIPQNAGTILRLAACLDVEAHIIEPAGFPTSDRAFRRAGMDYLDHVSSSVTPAGAISTPGGAAPGRGSSCSPPRPSSHISTAGIEPDDVLLFGRETAGVPPQVHAAADLRLTIPIKPDLRSLNVAMACAMALGEALRQTRP